VSGGPQNGVSRPFRTSGTRGGAMRRRYRQESVLRMRRRAEPHVAELKVVCLLALEIPCPWFGEKLKVRTHVASRGENLFSE